MEKDGKPPSDIKEPSGKTKFNTGDTRSTSVMVFWDSLRRTSPVGRGVIFYLGSDLYSRCTGDLDPID